MAHILLTFAAVVASVGALGVFALLRMASLCSREEEISESAISATTAAPITEPAATPQERSPTSPAILTLSA
ncbi:hypothetical protein [Variovorax ginsengisoli]|uniref:Uncharacterized protein n=1 Tax=Variovorax ginsengisoli TaxID=363844 RepID=A0ABT9SBS6_9BURK|nr:hypothetical protein [Variovorax ginsengisoli]MDP9901806.1 hypothetical protein [Variovorax ginsengisoli]